MIREIEEIKNTFLGLSEKERLRRYHKQKIDVKELGFFFMKDFKLPKTIKVMMIEPCKNLRSTYGKLIRNLDLSQVDLHFIKNGYDGIAEYEKGNTNYDIIILPLQMPLYGVDCALKFRALGFKGIILLYSASYYKTAMQAMLNGNMDGYINKMTFPFVNLFELIDTNRKKDLKKA